MGLIDAYCENEDIYFPVLESKCKFTVPIKNGTKILIKTKLEPPVVAKLMFTHIVTGERGSKYAEGTTAIGTVSKTRGLMIGLDERLKEIIAAYLNG
jgi:acyl-CoA thioester hydrolase